MKRFLSTVLALVMVAATFTMLVTNVAAVEEATSGAATMPKILYEENFDDLNGKTPAQILAGANMTDERSGMQDYLAVNDGRLYYGSYSNTANHESYVVLSDDRLLNGYTVEYKLTYLEYSSDQNPICFTSSTEGNYEGFLSQIRPNGGVVTGLRNNGWVNCDISVANKFTEQMHALVGDTEKKLTNLLGQEITVKSEIIIGENNASTVNTYVNGTLVQSKTNSVDPGKYFTKNLRLSVYPGTVAKIDDLTVTASDGTLLLTQNFDGDTVKNAGNDTEFLSALGWKIDKNKEVGGGKRLRYDGGALILGKYAKEAASGQEELILGGYYEEAKNGFVVEYDFEIIQTTGSGTANKSVGFYSAKASGTNTFNGWFSQIRWGRNVVCGAYNVASQSNNSSMQNAGTDYNDSRIVDLTGGKASMQGYRLAVRVVFDPQEGYVTTYAQPYTGSELTWKEEYVIQQSPDLAGYENLFDGYVRLIIEGNMKACIDNIKITTLTEQEMEVIYTNDFESIDGDLGLAGTGTAAVVEKEQATGDRNKALYLKGSKYGTLFSSWRLMEGYQLEFDLFMIESTGVNGLYIMGSDNIKNTWNFAINNTKVLNAPKKSNKWQNASESMKTALSKETWYRFRLTVDPFDGVTVEMENANGVFEVIDEYSNNRKNVISSLSEYLSGAIGIQSDIETKDSVVVKEGEFYLDNFKVSVPKLAKSLVYSADFEYDFGEGAMTSTDRGAIAQKSGMYFQAVTNTAVSVDNVQTVNVNNHALHMTTAKWTVDPETGEQVLDTNSGSLNALFVEEEVLMDGFEMYVDINLKTPAESNAIHIAGDHSNVHSTWNVVYRGGTEKRFLNGLKGGGSWLATHYTPSSYSYGTWYTLHIVMDPVSGVSLRVKATNGGAWSAPVVYDATTLSKLSSSTNYLSGIIGLQLNDTSETACTDVYLDNISVYTDKKQVVVYENDFNDADLATKTDSALMQALDWKVNDNNPLWHSSYVAGQLTIEDGAVKMIGRNRSNNNQISCYQIKAKELAGDYTVTFRMKQLSSTTKTDYGLTLAGGDLGLDQNNSWLMQFRYNGGYINGGRSSAAPSTWYGHDTAGEGRYSNNSSANEWFTVTLHVSNELGNRVSIRRDSNGAYMVRDRQTATERAYNPDTYNEYLRILCYGQTDFMIDDFKIVVYEDVVDTKTTAIYENSFDVANTSDQDAILSQYGWTLLESNKVSNAKDAAARDSISIQDGRLVINNAVAGADGNTSILMVKDDKLPFAENIVVEYDFEYLDVLSGKSGDAIGFWTGAVTGLDGIAMQARPNGNVLAAARYTQGTTNTWYDLKHHATGMMTPKATATTAGGQANVITGSRFSVRIEFNDKVMYVYIKDYNADRDWDPSRDLAAVSHFSDQTQGKMLLDQYLRFICYNGLSVAIDNVKVTAENVSAKLYGYQYTGKAGDGLTTRNVRLVGLINADMRQNASAVGYKITLTKANGATATKEISCDYVYSMINAWGNEPTKPGELVNGASNIYALHITGVNEAVDIEVTPFYVVKNGGNTIYGSTASFHFDPANPPA